MNEKQIMKERIKYRHPMLHYTEYNSNRHNRPFPDIPWHWHEDFELSCIKKGKIIYQTVSKTVTLDSGDVAFINSRVIHSATPIEPRTEIHHISQFFDNGFVSGGEGSPIDTKYVIPLQKNEEIDMIIFRAEDEKNKDLFRLIDKNSQLFDSAEKYYEFELRKNIYDIWRIILDSVEGITDEAGISSLTNQRLRGAITYIQKYYNERITLDDIANHIHVSVRECNRMFNKHLSMSPINYLTSVRLQKATAMLSDTNKSIADIAIDNGFSGSSYFGLKFKQHYNITPNEYRKNLNI